LSSVRDAYLFFFFATFFTGFFAFFTAKVFTPFHNVYIQQPGAPSTL